MPKKRANRLWETLDRLNQKIGPILLLVSIPSVVKDLSWWKELVGWILVRVPHWAYEALSLIGFIISPVLDAYLLVVDFLFSWLPISLPIWISAFLPPLISILVNWQLSQWHWHRSIVRMDENPKWAAVEYAKQVGAEEEVSALMSEYGKLKRPEFTERLPERDHKIYAILKSKSTEAQWAKFVEDYDEMEKARIDGPFLRGMRMSARHRRLMNLLLIAYGTVLTIEVLYTLIIR